MSGGKIMKRDEVETEINAILKSKMFDDASSPSVTASPSTPEEEMPGRQSSSDHPVLSTALTSDEIAPKLSALVIKVCEEAFSKRETKEEGEGEKKEKAEEDSSSDLFDWANITESVQVEILNYFGSSGSSYSLVQQVELSEKFSNWFVSAIRGKIAPVEPEPNRKRKRETSPIELSKSNEGVLGQKDTTTPPQAKVKRLENPQSRHQVPPPGYQVGLTQGLLQPPGVLPPPPPFPGPTTQSSVLPCPPPQVPIATTAGELMNRWNDKGSKGVLPPPAGHPIMMKAGPVNNHILSVTTKTVPFYPQAPHHQEGPPSWTGLMPTPVPKPKPLEVENPQQMRCIVLHLPMSPINDSNPPPQETIQTLCKENVVLIFKEFFRALKPVHYRLVAFSSKKNIEKEGVEEEKKEGGNDSCIVSLTHYRDAEKIVSQWPIFTFDFPKYSKIQVRLAQASELIILYGEPLEALRGAEIQYVRSYELLKQKNELRALFQKKIDSFEAQLGGVNEKIAELSKDVLTVAAPTTISTASVETEEAETLAAPPLNSGGEEANIQKNNKEEKEKKKAELVQLLESKVSLQKEKSVLTGKLKQNNLSGVNDVTNSSAAVSNKATVLYIQGFIGEAAWDSQIVLLMNALLPLVEPSFSSSSSSFLRIVHLWRSTTNLDICVGLCSPSAVFAIRQCLEPNNFRFLDLTFSTADELEK